MYNLQDFKDGVLDKQCFDSKIIFEWIKTGKISYREFGEYLDSLKEHSYQDGALDAINHYGEL